MRTTITLDPDVETLVKRAMRETGGGFKAVINDALRRSLARPQRGTFEMPPPVLGGEPLIDISCSGALWSSFDVEDLQRLNEHHGAR